MEGLTKKDLNTLLEKCDTYGEGAYKVGGNVFTRQCIYSSKTGVGFYIANTGFDFPEKIGIFLNYEEGIKDFSGTNISITDEAQEKLIRSSIVQKNQEERNKQQQEERNKQQQEKLDKILEAGL